MLATASYCQLAYLSAFSEDGFSGGNAGLPALLLLNYPQLFTHTCLVRGAKHRGPGWLSRCGQAPPRAFDLPVESDPVGDRVPVPTALSMRSYLRSAGFLPLTVRPRPPLVGTAGHHRRCELAQQRRRMGYVGDWQFARPTRSHRGYPLAGEAIAEPSSRASSWGS